MNGQVWENLAAPIPASEVQWRQDGRPVARGGKFSARFVAYIDAQFVRARLDEHCPGEWMSRLEILPMQSGDENEEPYAFKCTLTVCGVAREDVGVGKDYKSAASDAFKRAAVRFGIAHDLYAFDANWVDVDGDGKFAKPLQDPGEVYAKKHARRAQSSSPLTGRAPEPRPVPAGEHTPASSPKSDLFFGKPKGTSLGEYDNDTLKEIIAWALEKSKTGMSPKLKMTIDTARGILADRSLNRPTTEAELDAVAVSRLADKPDDLPF